MSVMDIVVPVGICIAAIAFAAAVYCIVVAGKGRLERERGPRARHRAPERDRRTR